MSNATDPNMTSIRCSDKLKVHLTYESDRELSGAAFMVGIYSGLNQSIYRLDSEGAGNLQITYPRKGELTCISDPLNISPGRYLINLAIMVRGMVVDHVEQATFMDIEPDDFYGTGALPTRDGVLCLIPQQWWFKDN